MKPEETPDEEPVDAPQEPPTDARAEHGALVSTVQSAAGRAASAAGRVAAVTADSVSSVAETIGDVAESLEQVGSAVGAKAGPIVRDVVHEVGDVAKGARQLARRRTSRARPTRSSKTPLPNLYQVHPEARNAAIRERGVIAVPLEQIAGTTVSSVPRAMDFLPMGTARTPGWQARWDRILRAMDRLVPLPPIDVFRYGDRYWVADGHNRVAAAHRNGQLDVDANVVDLIGSGAQAPATPIAGYLEDSTDLRAVGSGRQLHSHTGREEHHSEHATDRDRPEREAPG
jgi:hypothetical protein